MDGKAEELIRLYDQQKTRNASFYDLFQRTADLTYPRENNITRTAYIGEDKMVRLLDPTAVMASMEMASGLSQNLVPPGQKFFDLRAMSESLNQEEDVKRTLATITNIVHEQLFGSNFMLQLNETLRSLCVFGTGNLYSEYTTYLNFRDYDIGNYFILENSKHRVDTMLMKFIYTARQAYQEWGDNAGENILKAMENEKDHNKEFEFIHIVRPREERNPGLQDFMNMPFESIFISVKDKVIVEEGGYDEFPYHVPRWSKSSNEVFGRGRGIFILPKVGMLQSMYASFIECGNKHNNPPLEVLESFEGDVNVTPGAINNVQQLNSIGPIHRGALGNFVITREIIEMEREEIRKAFFNDVFVQLANLKGDRRTTLEIRERIGEGLNRLGPPIGRLQEELFDPLITRVLMLLLRNGQLPPLPAKLSGQSFKIEYIGRLALELKSHQARGFQQWVFTLAEMEQVLPGIIDNIDGDSGARHLGETLGVNIDDIATMEEVAEKRRIRAEQEQAAKMAEMAQVAAEGYGKTTGAPEEGSPMAGLMAAAEGT